MVDDFDIIDRGSDRFSIGNACDDDSRPPLSEFLGLDAFFVVQSNDVMTVIE